jgi:hypothetical protein
VHRSARPRGWQCRARLALQRAKNRSSLFDQRAYSGDDAVTVRIRINFDEAGRKHGVNRRIGLEPSRLGTKNSFGPFLTVAAFYQSAYARWRE